MAEPRNTRGGAAGNGVITIGGKSINMIRSQRDRALDAFRDAYYKAENGNPAELDAELERLNRRLTWMNTTVQRYEDNISRQPEYEAISQQLRATFRNSGRSPEEALLTAGQLSELRNRRNNLRYPRSVYARNNRRG
jgi:hypothetical protein